MRIIGPFLPPLVIGAALFAVELAYPGSSGLRGDFLPSVIILPGTAWLLILVSFGTTRVFAAMRALFREASREERATDARVFSYGAIASLACGVLNYLALQMFLLSNVNDPSQIGPHMANAIAGLMLGLALGGTFLGWKIQASPDGGDSGHARVDWLVAIVAIALVFALCESGIRTIFVGWSWFRIGR